MRALFQPNAFSKRVPRFAAASDVEARTIASFLQTAYPNIAPTEIQRIGAFEINSDNWRIDTARESYVLKRVGAARHVPLAAQAAICRQLRDRGLALPELVSDREGCLISRATEHAYCLSRFVPGQYFGSERSQWLSLLNLCRRLFEQCDTLIVSPEVPARNLFNAADVQTIAELRSGAVHPAMGDDGRRLMLDVFAAERAAQEAQSLERRQGIFHIDIHPHNLICRGAEIVLLTDFESLQVTDPFLSLAFGLFKCLRELLVDASESLRVALRAIRAEYAAIFPNHDFREIIGAARVELLKRALSITRDLLRTGETRWEFMLETQLTGLAESEHLCRLLSRSNGGD